MYFSKFYIKDIIIYCMVIQKPLHAILALIAELTHNNMNEDVPTNVNLLYNFVPNMALLVQISNYI